MAPNKDPWELRIHDDDDDDEDDDDYEKCDGTKQRKIWTISIYGAIAMFSHLKVLEIWLYSWVWHVKTKNWRWWWYWWWWWWWKRWLGTLLTGGLSPACAYVSLFKVSEPAWNLAGNVGHRSSLHSPWDGICRGVGVLSFAICFNHKVVSFCSKADHKIGTDEPYSCQRFL